MRATDSDAAFRELLAQRGLIVETLTAETAITAMTDFCLAERASDTADINEPGDMLLFQWGAYDWGDGPSFEYNLTRQFFVEGYAEPDDAIWQLLLTLHYDPGAENAAIDARNRWCEHPSQLNALVRFIENSEATAYVRAAVRSRVELRLEQAG